MTEPLTYLVKACIVILIMDIYLAPAIICQFRNHHNRNSIFIINLFFGWTIIGWVACLAWSFSQVKD